MRPSYSSTDPSIKLTNVDLGKQVMEESKKSEITQIEEIASNEDRSKGGRDEKGQTLGTSNPVLLEMLLLPKIQMKLILELYSY